MKKNKIIAIIFGAIIFLLGLLWFLQGSNLVHIKPILCFANCEPVTGKSLTWQIAGAIFFIIGTLIIYKNIKKAKNMNNQNQECCPKFDPALWDDKEFNWENKKFIRSKVFTLFYMPINFGSVIKKLDAKVQEAGARFEDNMGLSDHTSKWNMDLYLAVDKEVQGTQNTTLSGKYYSKVYEGNFKETGQWCQDFENVVKSKEMSVKNWYMWYTTCPKCAKKYGKNYVVIIGKVE